MNKTKFLLSALLAAGSAALFGAPENNPTYCEIHGHSIWGFAIPIPCIGSISACPASVTIKQYENFSPAFIGVAGGGSVQYTKSCSRCGYNEPTITVPHSVESYIEGTTYGSEVNTTSPGTVVVRKYIVCNFCGQIAQASCTITIQPGPPPPPTPPIPPVAPTYPDPGDPDPGDPDPGDPDPGNPDPGDPDPGNPDPGNPDPGNPDPGNPDPPIVPESGTKYVKSTYPATPQPIYVDIFGLPVEMKRPQAEEEKDQPESFLKINMGSLLPSISVADISIPVGNGDLSLELRRNFNMEGVSSLGDFGHNWTSNLQSGASYPGKVLKVQSENGSTELLDAEIVTVGSEDGIEFNYVFAKTLNSEPNYETAFTISGSGSSGRYKIFTPWITSSGESSASKTFVYFDTLSDNLIWCRKFGTRYQFERKKSGEAGFRLSRVIDRNDNSIRYEYDAVTKRLRSMYNEQAPNICLTFEYTLRGQISKVTAPDGNEWIYNYTIATGGDSDSKILLSEISAPPAEIDGPRAITRFSYEAMNIANNNQYFEGGNNLDSENPEYIWISDGSKRIIDALTAVAYPNGTKIQFQYAESLDEQVKILSKVISPAGEVNFVLKEACSVADEDSLDYEHPEKARYRDLLWTYVNDINGNRWDYQFDQRTTSVQSNLKR